MPLFLTSTLIALAISPDGVFVGLLFVVCPLLVALALAAIPVSEKQRLPWSVFLFFTITITSAIGLTEPLTGMHREGGSPLFFGLSFYTATLALWIAKNEVHSRAAVFAANPLLIVSGPILTHFGRLRHKRFLSRARYYVPFFNLGLFLYLIVATPLTQALSLIEASDLASVLAFGVIFEIFVYANFCGLSLILYGLFGVLGYRIPLNFRQPFSSRNLVEFWKGWHLSLSMVLKELFYRPARKKGGTYAAIMATFLASALWHGLTPNFIMWGFFHGVMYIAALKLLERGYRGSVQLFLLVVAIVLGRVIFADGDIDRLLQKLSLTWAGCDQLVDYMAKLPVSTMAALVVGVIFIGSEIAFRNVSMYNKRNYRFYRGVLIQAAMLAAMVLFVEGNTGPSFAVYGQR